MNKIGRLKQFYLRARFAWSVLRGGEDHLAYLSWFENRPEVREAFDRITKSDWSAKAAHKAFASVKFKDEKVLAAIRNAKKKNKQ